MKITKELLLNIFPKADINEIKEFVTVFNKYNEAFELDSPLRIAHFFAQLREEVGPRASIRSENFNYSTKALKVTFSRFRKNPEWAEKYGRNAAHSSNPFMIACIAYADRMGNGDIASADGWKYRGRGLIQLTGKNNYKAVSKLVSKITDEEVNILENPDTVGTPSGAMLSAMAYWKISGLAKIADTGAGSESINAVTKIVNMHTDSYRKRRIHFNNIYPTVTQYA